MSLRKPETIGFWCGRLPHWEVVGGRYFITIHTAGAIPLKGQAEIRKLSQDFQQATRGRLGIHRKIFAAMENWLDAKPRNAWLKESKLAKVVVNSLLHYNNWGIGNCSTTW
jgi:hypothetical protein